MQSELKHCMLCPRRCGADREKQAGACGSGARLVLSRAALHYGEEPCVSGKQGSGAIFFSGCSLHCVFCQNRKISQERYGAEVSVERLADIFRELEAQGANNINLVTPTQWTAHIIAALERYRPRIPILYNCGGYERVDTLKRLEGLVDVWLPDFKYADGELAGRCSAAPDYPEVAVQAIGEMLRQCGDPVLNQKGIIQRGVIIRHLVLPLHLKNSAAVLKRILREFGAERWISLLFQYTPLWDIPECPELNRALTARERARAEACLEELGFINGYVQEADSKGVAFIPDFDLRGVEHAADLQQ